MASSDQARPTPSAYHCATSARRSAESRPAVAQGHVYDQNGKEVADPQVEFRMKLLDVEEGRKAVIRDLIVNSRNTRLMDHGDEGVG